VGLGLVQPGAPSFPSEWEVLLLTTVQPWSKLERRLQEEARFRWCERDDRGMSDDEQPASQPLPNAEKRADPQMIEAIAV